jgi:hypothetical protein
MRKLVGTAALSSLATAAFCFYLPAGERLLENKRVTVSRVLHEPGQARERYIRTADQVIVFLDDCEYERIDSATKEKTIRRRKSGEVIWHDKGAKAYRTLVIELK